MVDPLYHLLSNLNQRRAGINQLTLLKNTLQQVFILVALLIQHLTPGGVHRINNSANVTRFLFCIVDHVGNEPLVGVKPTYLLYPWIVHFDGLLGKLEPVLPLISRGLSYCGQLVHRPQCRLIESSYKLSPNAPNLYFRILLLETADNSFIKITAGNNFGLVKSSSGEANPIFDCLPRDTHTFEIVEISSNTGRTHIYFWRKVLKI